MTTEMATDAANTPINWVLQSHQPERSHTMAATTTKTKPCPRREARSNAAWDALARDVIVPRLQEGESMTDIRAEFGSGATIRRALLRIGYNTKGEPTEVAKTT